MAVAQYVTTISILLSLFHFVNLLSYFCPAFMLFFTIKARMIPITVTPAFKRRIILGAATPAVLVMYPARDKMV